MGKNEILFLKEQAERSIDLNYFTVECDKHFSYVIITSKDIPQTYEERKNKWNNFRNFIECNVALMMTEEDVKFLNQYREEKDQNKKELEDRINQSKFDQILIRIMDYDLPKLSEEQSAIVYKFMRDYEDIMNIELPSSANSDVNALYFLKDTREILIKFLDLLYKPLTR